MTRALGVRWIVVVVMVGFTLVGCTDSADKHADQADARSNGSDRTMNPVDRALFVRVVVRAYLSASPGEKLDRAGIEREAPREGFAVDNSVEITEDTVLLRGTTSAGCEVVSVDLASLQLRFATSTAPCRDRGDTGELKADPTSPLHAIVAKLVEATMRGAAEDVVEQGGSGAPPASTVNVTYLDPDEPSTGPVEVSALFEREGASFAIRAGDGICYWSASSESTTSAARYGHGEPCTAEAAFTGATSSNW